MNKILNWLYLLPTKIKSDKLMHFFASSILLTVCILLSNVVIAYLIVLFSAIFKELYNDWYKGKGNVDVWDAVYSILPILLHLITS